MAKFFTQRRKGAKLLTVAFLFLAASSVAAQSIDPNVPSPVRSNTVNGRIAARDLGDARLTDHYYAFTGTPGDLLITVQSSKLNGDVDVFTAGTLRPLLKLTLYAELSSPITKGILPETFPSSFALLLRFDAVTRELSSMALISAVPAMRLGSASEMVMAPKATWPWAMSVSALAS